MKQNSSDADSEPVKKRRHGRFGPGFLVAAAFVGPGTIFTASKAGSGFGYTLLWAISFSIAATIVLQEMTARLGVITGLGLGQSLRKTFQVAWQRWVVFALVILAILFGNTAYQAGNITGAATGLANILGNSFQLWAVPIAIVAWLLLMTGRFKLIQNVLIVLVGLMSLLFIFAALASKPDWSSIMSSLVIPSIPATDETSTSSTLVIIIALIGTTVVPYNLFLHSSSAAETWGNQDHPSSGLTMSRVDLVGSVLIGGLITAAILISAAVAFGGAKEEGNIAAIATQLESVMGGASKWVFGIGLFSAGLTSAITAPLAAAYATAGCLGWDMRISDWRFRLTFSFVIVFGLVACLSFSTGKSPTQLVIIAQFANGLLLPIVSIFLLIVMNNSRILDKYTNGIVSNIFGVLIVLVTTGLGINQIYKAINGLIGLF